MRLITSLLTAILLLGMPVLAMAAPKVSMTVKAEIEKTSLDENGDTKIERVVVDKVQPGQKVFYTLSYENSGTEKAVDVTLNNRIPDNTTYQAGSAWGLGSDIAFSIDFGESFKQPALLVYEVQSNGKTEQRKASPEKYTNIRWIVKEIQANARGEVGFTVVVN